MKEQVLTTVAMGQFIRQARKVQGLTQADLAGIACVGRRFIVDLENGKETVQFGKVMHILGVLGIALTISHTWENL